MTEFSNRYKEGVNHLDIPNYSIEELRSCGRHRNYVRKKNIQNFATVVCAIVLFSIVTSATVYAAYTIHKNIQFTSYGLKIDFSDPEDDSDPDEVTPYTDTSVDSIYRQEDFDNTETLTQNFESWEEALKVIGFPVVYPKQIPYSELHIEYLQTAVNELVFASYFAPGKAVTIEYAYYLSGKWSYAVDYNAQIIDHYVYTNKHQNDFWITVCQYGDTMQEAKVVAYINDYYMVSFTFYGYEDAEIYEVLDEMDWVDKSTTSY